MSSNTVVTRFAPSPTGYLHVGGARTALFNWLLARHLGGKYLLRIEDTDLARSTRQAVDQLLEDLKWLGLNWDNADPVYQSRRLATYNKIIDDLKSRGLAYDAFETPGELDAQRKIAEKEKRAFVYRRPPKATEDRFRDEGRTSVVRFAMEVKEYRFADVVLGKEIVLPAVESQDFVIRKTDGMPTYHFAVVVDDAEMGVTHILRGQEHLKNTFNHIALQDVLGYTRPAYGHLPVILNTDGSKMGKRDRDKKVRHQASNWLKNTRKNSADLAVASGLPVEKIDAWLKDDGKQLDPSDHAKLMPVIGLKESDLPEILVHDFRKNGYLPAVLNNFLALLGWSPGGDREHMSMSELVELFGIDGIGKANAKFNREKLLAFNTEACAAVAPAGLVKSMRDFLAVNPGSPMNRATDDELAKIIAMKSGFRTLRQVEESSRFLFIPPDKIAYESDAIEKVLRKNDRQGATALKDIREVLASVTDWTAAHLEPAVQQYCDAKQLQLGKVAQPIRVAISGGTISPPIFLSLEFLGRDSTLARIDRCLSLA